MGGWVYRVRLTGKIRKTRLFHHCVVSLLLSRFFFLNLEAPSKLKFQILLQPNFPLSHLHGCFLPLPPPSLPYESFRRSLAMADAQLGCWHPNTISAAADLGACLSALGESGDWAEAEHVLKRVSEWECVDWWVGMVDLRVLQESSRRRPNDSLLLLACALVKGTSGNLITNPTH